MPLNKRINSNKTIYIAVAVSLLFAIGATFYAQDSFAQRGGGKSSARAATRTSGGGGGGAGGGKAAGGGGRSNIRRVAGMSGAAGFVDAAVVGSATATIQTNGSCIDAYIGCMDTLIPYVLEKNSFLKKDDAIVKMQNAEKHFRCVYDNKVKDLFDRYNYNCVNDTSKQGKCSADDNAFISFGFGKKPSVGEVTPSSTAYYKALQDIVAKGQWNKIDIAIFDDLKLDKSDLSGGKSSGVINIAAAPALINSRDELNTSSGICLNGEAKTSLRGLDANALSVVNAYITALDGCKQYEKKLSDFYRSGTDPKETLCSKGIIDCVAKNSKATFLSASKTCIDYENALMATRVEWQGKARALVNDNAGTIKREIMMWQMNEDSQDVALNVEITNMQNNLFKGALDKFKSCMRTACRSGGVGEYEGCVDSNGLVQSRILDAGLTCYPEYKITMNTTAKTLSGSAGAYGPQMEEMLADMLVNDEEYIKMSINAIKTQISEAYMSILKKNCELASGKYDNELCFWQLVRESEFESFKSSEERSWDGNKAAGKSVLAAVKAGVGGLITVAGSALNTAHKAAGAGLEGAGSAVGNIAGSPMGGAAASSSPYGMIAVAAGGAAKGVGGVIAENGDAVGQGMMAAGAGIVASSAKDLIDIDQANRADADGNRASDDITARMNKDTAQLSDSYIILPGTSIDCGSSTVTNDSSSRDKEEGKATFMNLFSQHAGNSDKRKQSSSREHVSEKYYALIGAAQRDACTIGTFVAEGWGQALERANMTDLFFKLKSTADVKGHAKLAASGDVPVIQNINEIKYGKSPKKAIEQEFEKMIRSNWSKLFPKN